MRSDFQIYCVSFSESFGALISCDHPVPFQQLTPRLSMWCFCTTGDFVHRLGAMRNEGLIWLVLAVLAFRLPLRDREISTSVNNSVLQRSDCLYCIICEKFLPQNLICGSINLKNSSECSICLLNKEQVIAEDSHPYHFVLLSSLWEEHKGPRSLFLTLSLAKVWKACFHSISLQK